MNFTDIDRVVKLVYMNDEFRIDMDLYLKIAARSYWQARWQVENKVEYQIFPIRNTISKEMRK